MVDVLFWMVNLVLLLIVVVSNLERRDFVVFGFFINIKLWLVVRVINMCLIVEGLIIILWLIFCVLLLRIKVWVVGKFNC